MVTILLLLDCLTRHLRARQTRARGNDRVSRAERNLCHCMAQLSIGREVGHTNQRLRACTDSQLVMIRSAAQMPVSIACA